MCRRLAISRGNSFLPATLLPSVLLRSYAFLIANASIAISPIIRLRPPSGLSFSYRAPSPSSLPPSRGNPETRDERSIEYGFLPSTPFQFPDFVPGNDRRRQTSQRSRIFRVFVETSWRCRCAISTLDSSMVESSEILGIARRMNHEVFLNTGITREE